MTGVLFGRSARSTERGILQIACINVDIEVGIDLIATMTERRTSFQGMDDRDILEGVVDTTQTSQDESCIVHSSHGVTRAWTGFRTHISESVPARLCVKLSDEGQKDFAL